VAQKVDYATSINSFRYISYLSDLANFKIPKTEAKSERWEHNSASLPVTSHALPLLIGCLHNGKVLEKSAVDK